MFKILKIKINIMLRIYKIIFQIKINLKVQRIIKTQKINQLNKILRFKEIKFYVKKISVIIKI